MLNMPKFLRKQPVYGTNFFMRGTIIVKKGIKKPKMKNPDNHVKNDNDIGSSSSNG
ncbi:hypothetical protein B4168_4134 [Anoxybacillus flavithermus]|nr:hypothetical protein B4168_4134 [Anoxybacillus flavithermus]OAO84710.1 hypothetical protein GT23_3381 [Parageobacillus thermoglucosidasius]